MAIKGVVPQLRTKDLASTIRFYTEKLGFTVDFQYEDFYAGIRCRDQTIHLKFVCDDDPSISYVDEGGHLHLYLETKGVADFADRLKTLGVPIVKDVHDTPWQTREFVIHDDQGHTLYFGEPLLLTGTEISKLFTLPTAVKCDPAIAAWFEGHSDELGAIAWRWFEAMRGCGDDVRELLHDGHPTACVGEAAFGYVNTFTSHVNIGFFRGAQLSDPNCLLQDTGKFMRHVKLRPDIDVDVTALSKLIETAYTDMKERLKAPEHSH